TAESQVGDDFRDQDLADQLSIRFIAINALAGARPYPSGSVDTEAIVESVLWGQFAENVARSLHALAVCADAVAANGARRILLVRRAGVGDIEQLLVRREGDAVRPDHIVDELY